MGYFIFWNFIKSFQGVQLAEHKMNQLQNEIDQSRHQIAPPSDENTIDQSRSSWSSSSHASSSSSTNRNSLNASLFSSFTSSSSSLNPSSTTMSHTNESLSKSYQSSSSISNLTATDFVLKPKSEYCTLPNMKKMRERPASKHAPLKRRDVEPPAIAPPGGHRFEQINILRRSVSEMHLVKEKRFFDFILFHILIFIFEDFHKRDTTKMIPTPILDSGTWLLLETIFLIA